MGKQDLHTSGYKKRRKQSKEKLKKADKKDTKERAKIAKEATREALKKSVSLLSQALKVPGAVKNREFANNFTSEVESILTEIHSEAINDESTILSSGKKGTNNKDGEESGTKRSSSKRQDSHNELCEVCDAGGDLLCCDTCNLVFHVACIRPKIASVPKGRWSCAYCIVEGAAKGEVETAKRAIRSMKDLRRSKDLPCEDGDESRSNRHQCDMTIIRMGRQFVTRKLVHGQIVEMDRHNTLEKALFEIKTLLDQKKDELARRVGDTGDPSGTAAVTPHGTEAMHADGELWCIYCMDDASIPICAFCGCKTCFGKHSAENLLLCDGCDHEWHIYCLDPPLESIPDGHWFCKGCIASGKDKEVLEEEEQDRLAEEALAKAQAEFDAIVAMEAAATGIMHHVDAEMGGSKKRGRKSSSGAYIPQQAAPVTALGQEEAPVVRRPGRPKGSVGKKRAEMLNASYGNNMQASIRMKKKENIHISTQTNKGKRRQGALGDWDRVHCDTEIFSDGPTAIKEAIGLDFAKAVANRAARRLLLPVELASMENFRAWAPICDLRETLALFQQKRDLLVRHISGDAMNEGYFPETSDSTDQLNTNACVGESFGAFDNTSSNYDALMEGGMMFDDQELNAEGFGDQYGLEAEDPISMDM